MSPRLPTQHTSDLKRAPGSLGPAARFQEPALPARSPALTPGSGFTCQHVGNSPRVFWTLTPPTREPALATGSPRVLQPAASRPGSAKQQPAAPAQGRAWQPTRLEANQAYQNSHIISPSQQKDPRSSLRGNP